MQSQHEILMQDPEFRKEFAVEKFILECTEAIAQAMHEQNISKAELARLLGKSRPWATQLLAGGRNFTARTLAEVAFELGVELSVKARRAKTVEGMDRPAATETHADALEFSELNDLHSRLLDGGKQVWSIRCGRRAKFGPLRQTDAGLDLYTRQLAPIALRGRGDRHAA